MNELEAKCRSKGLVWISGEGKLDAKIVIIGEAPGAEEERLKRPFVGGAGNLLDNVLRLSDIDRQDVYLTNVVKVRPPKNDLKALGQLGLSINEFIPLLKTEIEKLKPNVIVALGNVALSALSSLHSIMQYRGSILESTLIPGLKVIPSIHPAAILRNYKWKPLLQIDMKKVKEESLSAEIKLPKRNFLIEPSFAEVRNTLELLDKSWKISCDIETDRTSLISCLSFSGDPSWAISIPFRNGYRSYWSEGEEYVMWKMMRDFFQSGKGWVYQNALFDMKFLIPKVGYHECYMDTMLCHQLIYAEIPKGLDTLASIYTREPYYKDERKVWRDISITKQLWLYNAKDSAVTLEVALALEKELREKKLEDFFFGYVMRLIPILLKLEMRGMRISSDKRDEIAKELRAKEEVLNKEIGVNVNSPKALAQFLYGDLGLPKMIHHKKGTVTTNKEALIKLRSKVR